MAQPTLKTLEKKVEDFNKTYEVGSRFVIESKGASKHGMTVTTRTKASILSGHSAVVWLNEFVGCWDIAFLKTE